VWSQPDVQRPETLYQATRHTGSHGFLEELDGTFLRGIRLVLHVMEPAQLLQNLGVVRIALENPMIRGFGVFVLSRPSEWGMRRVDGKSDTHIFVLLMHVADLEPNVLLGEGRRRVVDDVLEALEALCVLVARFVDDAQTKVDLVCLFEIGVHVHDMGEGLFGVVQGAVAVIEYAYAIPQLGLLYATDWLATRRRPRTGQSRVQQTLGLPRKPIALW
jgi:hypothetical protein